MPASQISRRSRLFVAFALACVVLLLVVNTSVAQIPEFGEFHTWTDLATIYNLGHGFRYDGDYGIRGLLTDPNWTLIYLRPSVRYNAKDWLLLHGGFALFYNFFKDVEDLPELRPWIGVRFVGPRPGGYTITNYIRLEGRMFYLKDEDRWDKSLRGRWQIQVVTPDFAIGKREPFYGIASVEPFFDLGPTTEVVLASRYRFNIGLGHRLARGLRAEVNYVFHKARVADGDTDFDFDDHIVRLRFFWVIN